jgi:hypothetical protein
MNSRWKDTGCAALAAATLALAACGGSGSADGYMPPPPPANTAPTMSAIGNQVADQDTAVTIDFGVDDRESGAAALTVAAAADGTGLFPADGVVLSGSGATRTLTLTPLRAARLSRSASPIRPGSPPSAASR